MARQVETIPNLFNASSVVAAFLGCMLFALPVASPVKAQQLPGRTEFTFYVDAELNIRDPKIKAVVLSCEVHRAGHLAAIAVGRTVLPKSAGLQGVYTLLVEAQPTAGQVANYKNIMADVLSGAKLIKEVPGTWSCTLALSEMTDGSNAKIPSKVSSAKSTRPLVIPKVSGKWTDF